MRVIGCQSSSLLSLRKSLTANNSERGDIIDYHKVHLFCTVLAVEAFRDIRKGKSSTTEKLGVKMSHQPLRTTPYKRLWGTKSSQNTRPVTRSTPMKFPRCSFPYLGFIVKYMFPNNPLKEGITPSLCIFRKNFISQTHIILR